MRLEAYYYSFYSTGIAEVDLILSAVACAGKAAHHTDAWSDEMGELYENMHGERPVDWIQNAGNELAMMCPGCQKARKDAIDEARHQRLNQGPRSESRGNDA